MNHLTKHLIIGSVLALGLGTTPLMAQHDGHGKGHHAAPAALTNCPITGEPINLAVSTVTDDGPVFFCCEGCVKKYQANPAKYATLVAAQRKTLAAREKIQVVCPVTNEPVDEEVFVESNGQKVYFCCKGCVNKYTSNPTKYASALANSYTFQTKCPVMDEEINPKVFTTTAKGKKIYFCCKGCDKKFVKNPGKYSSKLVAQGLMFEPRDLVPSKSDHGSHGGHDGHNH